MKTWIVKIFVLFIWGITDSHSAVTEFPDIAVVVDSEVSIPCNVTPSLPDDAVRLILWYRSDSGNPLYSVDSRTTREPKKNVLKTVQDRASFSMTRTQAHLGLKPVKEADGGEYKCRVDYRKSRTTNSIVKVIVVVPPKNLTIKDNRNTTIYGILGPLEEGATVTLVCETSGGRPTPSLTWWRGSTLIDETFTPLGRGVVKNELLLPELKRSDLLATLTCQASNTNLTLPLTMTLTVDLSLSPIEVKILTPRRPLSSGESLEIVCQTFGSRPPARLSWWIDQDNLNRRAKETVSGDGNSTLSRLQFRPTSEEHGKVLVCRAHNPETPDSIAEDKWELDIYFAPQLSLALGASQQWEHIREGSDVYFECNVAANPPVGRVSWRRQSQPLRPRHDVIIRNQSLLLKSVGPAHRGRYKCSATNQEGEGQSEETELTVQFSPVCVSPQHGALLASRDDSINVTCQVEADPEESLHFRWTLNATSRGVVDVNTFTSSGTTSILNHVIHSSSDFGTLSCWARNSIGVQRKPCMFTILPADEEPVLTFATVTAVGVGFLLSVSLLISVIICIVKSRASKDESEKTAGSSEKIHTPKLKHFEDDSPDIIPSKTFCTDFSSVAPDSNTELMYEKIPQKEHAYTNEQSSYLMKRVHFVPSEGYDGGITYAELCIPDNAGASYGRRRLDPPTEYADIDYRRGIFPTREDVIANSLRGVSQTISEERQGAV